MEMQKQRLVTLSKIRKIIGEHSEQRKVQETLIFCIEDGELISNASARQRQYIHREHTNDRAFIFTPTTKFEFTLEGELKHYSVGTILWQKKGGKRRYFLFRRQAYPIGYYTIPAGHLEMGETPQNAALREAYEETSLGIASPELFYKGEINEGCRRGANKHFWYVYICQALGKPKVNDEADIIGWFTPIEIINNIRLTKPTGILFKKLFGVTPKNIRNR